MVKLTNSGQSSRLCDDDAYLLLALARLFQQELRHLRERNLDRSEEKTVKKIVYKISNVFNSKNSDNDFWSEYYINQSLLPYPLSPE